MEDTPTTSQPLAPVVPLVDPPIEPPPRSKLPKILSSVVILIGVGWALYFGFNRQEATGTQDNGKVETPITASESACAQELANYPLSDWKAYDNTAFGIHLKYPNGAFDLNAPIEKYTNMKDAMLAVKNDVLLESVGDCSIDIYFSSLKDLETQDNKTYVSSKDLAYGRFSNVIPSNYTVAEIDIDSGQKATLITGGDLGDSLLKRIYYVNTAKNLAVEVTYYLGGDDTNSDTADKILANAIFDAQK